jgi:hypothetical protein
MQDDIEFVFPKQLAEEGFVADVSLDESGRAAGDFADALDDVARGVAQVVEHDDIVAALEKFHARMRANVAGAADN